MIRIARSSIELLRWTDFARLVPVTAAPPEVPAERLRAHAANLDALRSRFASVRATSQRIEKEQSAFGPVYNWIFTGLTDRHTRHDELIAGIEENLWLAADALRRVAAGGGDLAGLADGLGVPDGAPQPAEAEPSLVPMASLVEEVREGLWIDDLLLDPPVAESAADAVTSLRTAGLVWAVSTVEPLRQLITGLTGLPTAVTQHAVLWDSMAATLRDIAADLRLRLDADLRGYSGPGVRAYRAMMTRNAAGLDEAAATSAAMAVITRATEEPILLVRDHVRDLVAYWAASVLAAITRVKGVVPIRTAATHLATGVATARCIHAYVAALEASMATLSSYLDG